MLSLPCESHLLLLPGTFRLRTADNRVDCAGQLVGPLGAYKQFLAALHYELHALIAGHTVGPAQAAEAVANPPAAIFNQRPNLCTS